MEIHEIVMKLVGPVAPVGESHTDTKRFENLKALTEVIDKLMFEVVCVTNSKDNHQASMKKAGQYAQTWLNSWEGGE